MDRQKALIVNDKSLNIQALVYILRAEYEAVVAKSGTEALVVANRGMPDIILLDILMSGMDGYKVLTVLKQNKATRHIPIICIAALSDEDNEERGLALGAADYIHRANSAAVNKLRMRKPLQLINVLKQAEDASRVKSDFLAKVSPEIRTPMNSVIGITSIQLQKVKLLPEKKEVFLQIRFSPGVLLSLINDILDLLKVEAGKMKLFQRPHEISSSKRIRRNTFRDKNFSKKSHLFYAKS